VEIFLINFVNQILNGFLVYYVMELFLYKEIEEKPSPTEWGVKMPFANMMAEFSNSPTGGENPP
jgi:hypothetical protein